MLSTLFERCMKRRGVKDSDPYDWEKIENTQQTASNNPPSSNNFAINVQSQAQIKAFDPLNTGVNSVGTDYVPPLNATTQVAGSNISGIEYVSTID